MEGLECDEVLSISDDIKPIKIPYKRKVPEKPKPKIIKPSGIKNIGNSCYISSSVQCLKHTKELWEFLTTSSERDATASSPLTQDCEVLRSFTELLLSLKEDNHSVAPHKFKRVIAARAAQFSGTDQSDAQEFLSFLIDALREELDSAGRSVIEELFYGTFKSTIQCLRCKHQSVSKEPFMCLSLPIEEDTEVATVTVYTRSNHLLVVEFKYDENLTVRTLKELIQAQLLVNSLDFFVLTDKSVLPLENSKTIKQISRCESSWQLCAIEESDDYLIRVDIVKHQPSFLLGCRREEKLQSYALKERVRKLLLSNSGGELKGLKAVGQSLDFVVVSSAKDETVCSLELKPTVKLSEVKQLWKKLPHKQIEGSVSKGVENLGTLYGCLSKFGRKEKLQGNNQWMCPNCSVFTDAEKSIDYQTLPKILIIHLKRFKVYGKNSRKKVSSLVEFPLILLMTTTDQRRHMYSLYAVINHMGGIERGHYTAYCLNLKNRSEWLEFDDNKVKPISSSKLITDKAYVLLYEHTCSPCTRMGVYRRCFVF
eukprot:TRINITY_DN1987_c0_g1_i7.p1 TRINITY_DN1987_c0_g1~~TRINITY_DN1987_c0_g1_i7.p1  ORF type:complete len:539 (-),score=122.58 TRINITY_DN1987_c0_g1_i7:114-1730(-)